MNLDREAFPHPQRTVLEGQYTRLEPLDADSHAVDLFRSAQALGAEARFRYLLARPPEDLEDFMAWLRDASASSDPLFFAVVDKRTGRAEGRQALMRLDVKHGVAEAGHILWGPAIARTRVATEAFFLLAQYIFSLGYRRLEWKCDHRNEASRRAALRFGFQFEGVFRQHMIVRGENRDTAWFGMTDADWVLLRPAYERWLKFENFGPDGEQRHRLNSTVNGLATALREEAG